MKGYDDGFAASARLFDQRIRNALGELAASARRFDPLSMVICTQGMGYLRPL
jgi:hypothetical protein